MQSGKLTFRLVVLISLFFLVFPIMSVFANQLTTTMTWFVPATRTHSIAYGGTCSSTAFFFNENNAQIDADTDGNADKILPQPSRILTDANCQSSGTAGMIVTNSGNTSINLDANFAADLDTNLWVKVWMGSGAGCGTLGMGGWAHRCALEGNQDTTTAVTTSNCRDFNSSNDLVQARLVTGLPRADTNQLCFSGSLMAAVITQASNVAGGDHNGVFQTWSGANDS